ncbi:hypothetical protein FQZ97_747270 [compost metagenome]
MFSGRGGQVGTVEVEAGAEGVFAIPRWRHIAFGADHGGEIRALGGGRQPADLSADAFQLQVRGLGEAQHLGGAGQHHHGGGGELPLPGTGAPEVVLAA